MKTRTRIDRNIVQRHDRANRYEVNILRREVKSRRCFSASFATLSEAVRARDAYEAANPPKRPPRKHANDEAARLARLAKGRERAAMLRAAGLCYDCQQPVEVVRVRGGKRKKLTKCAECNRIARVQWKVRHER